MQAEVRENFERLWDEHRKSGKNGVPPALRNLINSAFSKIPVSTFPAIPCGTVVEIAADASIAEAVSLLSKHNIFSAPVKDVNAEPGSCWSACYLGMVDYAAVILWVLDQAELAAAAMAANTAAAAGMGAGALEALGVLVLGLTGPAAIAGLATAAVGAAVAGGFAARRGAARDGPHAADALGDEFYHIILREEPFKSTRVSQITRSYRWAPFLPVQRSDSMLTVLLLMSKFGIRNVPVVRMDERSVENLITQSAVVRGLYHCRGREWFDTIAEKSLSQLGLPLMTAAEVVSVETDKLILEAFTLMREKQIGGVPVVQPGSRNIVGNVSVRDIRYLLLEPELFAKRKELTVWDFISIVTLFEASGTLLMSPVVCHVSSTLVEVIQVMSQKKIHRIHVVDENDDVTGVITLRDIIACFVSDAQMQTISTRDLQD